MDERQQLAGNLLADAWLAAATLLLGEHLVTPDLDSLALFVRAAEMKNLTRAAEASLITAPAASRRLALLEHQFKTTFFERHSRGLDLTPAGERLLQQAREVIASVHHMRAQSNYAGAAQCAAGTRQHLGDDPVPAR